MAAALVVAEAKTRVWEGGVWGVHGEGLLVGPKEVLTNNQVTQEGKAGLYPGCFQKGRTTASLYLDVSGETLFICWVWMSFTLKC